MGASSKEGEDRPINLKTLLDQRRAVLPRELRLARVGEANAKPNPRSTQAREGSTKKKV